MSPTPRVIFIRHGETEWSRSGQHTSTTNLPLTTEGEHQMKATGHSFVGEHKLIKPTSVTHVFISPRERAQKTFELMFEDVDRDVVAKIPTTTTEDIREWTYGDYEGMHTKDIRALRKSRGLDQERDWLIWYDGCENGETPEEVTTRLDRLIEEIHEIQGKAIEEDKASDILIFAHGHILRAFVLRWLKRDLQPPAFIMDAGGVGVLSYEHHNVKEPALCIGSAIKPF
ncbi:putative phosphoglycerate mutase [Nadsonia fulvescens var. elongata DSM 6958]|uniref:Putative phosphoglycerate mutase n=1 Tax=Nadsonia fulvescens var. elongata DSM 6958 TaxID=857566 RepID=A0A1E3PQZ1_9ASCO|nr:putative phosphoglycerate mutase [Nadsonia fulvescens var. elongata DSM 6958]